MNLRDKKGSISIFVLVALLFMSAFLIISYANNVNKSKTIKEQFDIISDIYAYNDGDEGAYDKAYADLRKKNARIYSFENAEDADKTIFENTSTVELTKTFDGNMNNYRIYGNSMQSTYEGTQLFDYTTLTLGGSGTVTSYDNGRVIEVTGKAAWAQKYNDFITVTPGETYYFSVSSISGGNNPNIVIQGPREDGTYINHLFITPSKLSSSLTIPEGMTKMRIVFCANYSSTAFEEDITAAFNHFIISKTPIVRWEPYTGGASSPSPDYPQEIQSVGDETEQLLDLQDLEEKVVAGITWSCTNGVVKVKGTSSGYSVTESIGLRKVITGLTGNYYISGSNGGVYVYVRVVKDGNTTYYNNRSFSLDGTETAAVVYMQVNPNVTVDTTVYPMLNKGTIKLDYEPYGKYKIPIKISGNGKNLIDDSKRYYSANTIYFYEKGGTCGLFPAGTYTFSVVPKDGAHSNLYIDNAETGESILKKYTTMSATFTLDNPTYIKASVYKTSYTSVDDIVSAQIEKGSTATSYEPGIGTITTNIFLDEPLRKIENYADYVDFETGKVYRYIKTYDITGNEEWQKALGGNLYTRYYAQFTTDILGDRTTNNGMCNILNSVSFDELSATSKECIATWYQSDRSRTRIDICLSNDRLTTADELKVWLKANPVKLIYSLATPEEESINIPELKALEDYTKIEVLTGITPSKIELEYKAYTLD